MTAPYRLGTDPSTESPQRVALPTPTYVRTHRQTKRDLQLRNRLALNNAREEKPIRSLIEVPA